MSTKASFSRSTCYSNFIGILSDGRTYCKHIHGFFCSAIARLDHDCWFPRPFDLGPFCRNREAWRCLKSFAVPSVFWTETRVVLRTILYYANFIIIQSEAEHIRTPCGFWMSSPLPTVPARPTLAALDFEDQRTTTSKLENKPPCADGSTMNGVWSGLVGGHENCIKWSYLADVPVTHLLIYYSFFSLQRP